MSVTVYVEGGGDRAELQAQCRKGFHELLAKAGFGGRSHRVVPCGSRNDAFRDFKIALRKRVERQDDEYPILLVDSEDPVADDNQPDANPSGTWRHLSGPSDHWTRPSGAADDQAQLMVTTMETWLLADGRTLIDYFFPAMSGSAMSASALLPDANLESHRKKKIAYTLRNATQSSSKGRYRKGSHSFDLLGKVEPEELKSRLPHFRHFIETLDARLPPA